MLLFKWVERGLGLISTLMLVRLLSPADFGMVSMALSFIFMAELMAAFSFDVALIQNQNATASHFNSAWTANVMLGAAIAVSMLALAVPISRFYHQPEVFPVICALSLGPLLSSLENIGIVAYRKELDFRKEFIFQVSRKVMAFSVTIPLAFWLHSYWALVAGILVSKGGGTCLSYWVHSFRPRFSLKEVPTLLRFSKWLLLNNFVNFLKERSTDFFIGRLFGPGPLGIYNVNNEFASMPTNEMGAPMNRALLPGFAKMAGDKQALKNAYTNASGMVAAIAIPAGAGIFAVAPYLVPVMLGQQWISGIPVMEVLSLNSSLLVFHGTIVTALISTGHPGGVTRINALFVVVMLAGIFLLTGRFGLVGAAFSSMAACVLTTPLYLLQLRKHAGVPLSNFFRVILRPALASAAMIAAIRFSLPDYRLDMAPLKAGILLGSAVALGAVIYAVVLLVLWVIMGHPNGPERQIFSKIQSRVPSWIPFPGRSSIQSEKNQE